MTNILQSKKWVTGGVLALSVASLVACSGDSSDSGPVDNLSISLAGATAVSINERASANAAGFDTRIIAMNSEFGAAPTTNISVESDYDSVKDKFLKKINISFIGTIADTYSAATADFDYEDDTQGLLVLDNGINSGTSLSLTITSYGAVGGIVSGEFSGTLCKDLAFQVGKCATGSANLVAVNGSFSITHDADEIYVSQGMASAPISLGSTPVDTNNGTSLYTVTKTADSFYSVDIAPGKTYGVNLDGYAYGIDFHVYSDAAMTALLCENVSGNSTPIGCSTGVIASGVSKAYIKVVNRDATKNGDDYSILVQDSGPYVAQGMTASPVVLSSSNITGLTCDVAGGKCYYEVTGFTAASTYTLGLVNSSEFNTQMSVFDDSGFGTLLCSISSTVRSCAATPTGTSLYIETRTKGDYDIIYDITVSAGGIAYSNEGTKNAPIEMTGVTHTGVVGVDASYYSAAVTASTYYTISLSNASEAGLRVTPYDDNTLKPRLCRIDSEGSCTILTSASATSIILQVDGGKTLSGAKSFLLGIVEASSGGYRNEGTSASPIVLTLATDAAGMVGYEKDGSVYSVTGLTAATAYTVTMTNPSNQDIDFTVLDGSSAANQLCVSEFDTDAQRSCVASPTGTDLYIEVLDGKGMSNNGGDYTLNISPSI